MPIRAKYGLLLVMALSLMLPSTVLEYIMQNASATQCVRYSPEKYYERSDVIFVGTIIDIEYEPRFLEHGHYVSLNVSKSWKGMDARTITVHSEGGRFREVGSQHLVYADKDLLAIEVTFCGGTIQTDSGIFVDRELAFLDRQPTMELKNGHATSMNPFPLMGLSGLILVIAAGAIGVLKSGITIQMVKNALPVVAGLIVGILMIWAFSSITFPANIICYARPLEHIEKLSSIPVMVPTVLPEGYSFQGGEIVMGKGSFSLRYFTEPVCGGNYERSVSDGVILVSGSPIEHQRIPEDLTPTEYLDFLFLQGQKEISETEKRYSFADGREALAITATIAPHHTTDVLIADHATHTWYVITSSRTVEEAVSIAESLRTR